MSVRILQADACHLPLPDRSVDLVFGSPPYCDARTYGIGAQRKCREWVDWMLAVTAECLRVCKGPVCWVCAGVTRARNYWPAPEGLLWRWWELGGDCHCYRPCIYYKNGISGSGGDDWFRADTEYVLCFKRPGALAWSDNTACGHVPKYAPGGETQPMERNIGHDGVSKTQRRKRYRPNHRPHTKRRADGQMEIQGYVPPVLSNPGNVIRCKVGGGHLGHPLAHENEAPFPEALAERFVLSLCPPGGVVLDPFSGSGTTAAVALRHGRKAIATDIRESQCELSRRRVNGTQLPLLVGLENDGGDAVE